MTGSGEPPAAYIEYVLCTQMYHCLPSELDREDYSRVADHLACMDVEAQYREHLANQKSNKVR